MGLKTCPVNKNLACYKGREDARGDALTHLGVETGEAEFHLREHLPANKEICMKNVRKETFEETFACKHRNLRRV